MTNKDESKHRSILQRIARNAMLGKGLMPDFSPLAIEELNGIKDAITKIDGTVKDLRNLLWCSIDNDDSLDLDQLTVAIPNPGNSVTILVAIADVDAIVKKGSAIDDHAKNNTSSIYTAAEIFPMLPEKLSTGITSLNFAVDRLAIVVEMKIGEDGSLLSSDVYRAMVNNRAKLAYNSLAAWLENNGQMPEEVGEVKGLEDNLRLQNNIAKKLKSLRHAHGALDLDTIQVHPVFDGDNVKEMEVDKRNTAKDLIEDFMIAANGVTARYLVSKNLPSLRRVVRSPKRWDRIVELASEHSFTLPLQPDSKALDQFLLSAKDSDALRYPDLCLSIIKLLGPGEYVVELPGGNSEGHFGLAVKDYEHSTAPNRRYPDLITQRLLKQAMVGQSTPYTTEELTALASHCTQVEDLVKKIERMVEKSAAAMVMESMIGKEFDAIVTGASEKGTWVRLFQPPVEGKLISGCDGMEVGHRLRVKLVHTDAEHGFIDFKRV
ncbi:MAG: RNB domain-containing ribonuclease [Ignavibacteriaceae bacterium]|nr:RNB domain-containing ribonuclease [Ignavibacteriaceae bacterium]